MPDNLFSHSVTVQMIELMRSNFQWMGGGAPSGEKPKNEFTAAVSIVPLKEASRIRSAFSHLTLNRNNYPSNNFEFSASYFLSIRLSEADAEQHEGTIKDVVTKLVWTRFYDLAKILFVQSGIEGVDIPILPDTVTTYVKE